MTETTTAQSPTGEQVRAARESLRMSRQAFVDLAGLAGVSRLWNIEVKNSWKPGDRELVDAVLRKIAAGEVVAPATARRVPTRREPKSAVASALRGPVSTCDPFDDPWFTELDDALAVVYVDPDAPVVAAEPEPRPLVDLPVPVYGASVLDVPDTTLVASNSEAEDVKRCPRKWWLTWYRQLGPKQRRWDDARSTGDRVHRALACWYVPDGQPRVDPRDALERIIVDDWTELSRQAREAGADEVRLGELAQSFQAANSLERAMVEGYFEWLKETGADSEYRVVGAEQAIYSEFQVDPYEFTVGPDGALSGSRAQRLRDVRWIARLDTRLVRTSDGVRLLEDHKTVGDTDAPQATLHGNPQMLTYLVLEWLNTPEGEARCDGALYNMLRKVKRTSRAKPPFYVRAEVRHNPVELENHKREMLAVARRILQLRDALDAGANFHDVVPRSWRDDCRYSCDFFPVCPMFDDGSRVEDALTALYQTRDPRLRYNDLERFEPPSVTA